MRENPKLFWARACMGEIFERMGEGLTGIFREMDGKIASNSRQKRWKTVEKQRKTVEKRCQPFAVVTPEIGVKMVSSFLSSMAFKIAVVVLKGFRDWCRLFWKIIILLPGNFK